MRYSHSLQTLGKTGVPQTTTGGHSFANVSHYNSTHFRVRCMPDYCTSKVILLWIPGHYRKAGNDDNSNYLHCPLKSFLSQLAKHCRFWHRLNAGQWRPPSRTLLAVTTARPPGRGAIFASPL